MIRFIDLTEAYWTDPEEGYPICAFLDTTTDLFVNNNSGKHTFSSLSDLNLGIVGDAERLASLIPDGFFGERKW